MPDMLQRFNSKLVNLMNTKKANRGYLTKERHGDMLIKLNNSKNKSSEIKPTDCQRLKKIPRNGNRQC